MTQPRPAPTIKDNITPETAVAAVTAAGHVEELRRFRDGFYRCLTKWPDATFELCEAMLCAPGPVSSIPALSLEPVFRRGHGSLYKALERGRVDTQALRDLLVEHRPANWPLVFAVDASVWSRCDAETSPQRGYYYSASKHLSGQPIVAGWSYQWITGLNWAHNSWTAPMDAARIPPGTSTVTATVTQVQALVARLQNAKNVPTNQTPMFVFDAGYDPIALSHELASTPATIVVRIRDDRVFYAAPETPEPGTVGRPRRHAARFACAEPDTWPGPDVELNSHDERYGSVHVTAWHHQHPRLGCRGHWRNHQTPPIVPGTVVRVDVEHLPKPNRGAKKTLWLWVAAGSNTHADLAVCWQAYLRRFDIEHTFRFLKNTLGWTTPSVRTPEQADRWTWLAIAAYTQLRLARSIVEDLRLPWERHRPTGRLTPTRVRRGFRGLGPTLGTPASPPKPSRAGPGRPKGTQRPPRQRHPAIKKAA